MAKDVFIIGISALWLTRKDAGSIVANARPSKATDLSSSIANGGELADLLASETDEMQRVISEIPGPLQILVPDDAHRPRGNGIAAHIWSGGFPAGSFRRIGRHVHVASPVFLMFTMASQLGPVELAMLGNEICGDFAYAPQLESGFVNRPRLARVSGIVAACSDMKGSHCVKKVRSVLDWLFDHARSPMESELALRFSLPKHRGGYGTRRPDLNHRFTLTERAARIAGKPYVRGDLVWEDDGSIGRDLDVEYLGEKEHAHRFGADLRRRDALVDSGVDVVELFKEHMGSVYSFDLIARVVCKKLDMKPPSRSDETMYLRKQLHDELLRIRWQGEAGRTRNRHAR